MRILFTLLTLSLSLISLAEGWTVPEDKKEKNAHFKFDKTSEESGKELYYKNCFSCHGDVGKNNYVKLNPDPGDLSTSEVAKQTDGELYYKLKKGKGLMPSFENSISSDDRWKIIAYIRTFHIGYSQIVELKDETISKDQIALKITKLEGDKFQVTATKELNGKTVKVKSVELELYVKRYFGQLLVDESKATNSEGKAIFSIEKNIPANQEGKITLIAKALNYENLKALQEFEYGFKNIQPPLNQERALWNTVDKAPIWLILGFSFGLLAIGAFIGFILLQLKNLRKQK